MHALAKVRWAIVISIVVVTLGLRYFLLPSLMVSFLIAVNVATFGSYAIDKRQARLGHWRISEATLLLLGAAGGTVAALCSQLLFRHKTRKARFQIFFWLIVVWQLVLLGLWIYYRGGGA